MLLDQYMPLFHFRESHQALVRAKPERIYKVARRFDLAHSRPSKLLFAMRGISRQLEKNHSRDLAAQYNFKDFEKLGFLLLEEIPPYEFIFGVAGKLWGLKPEIVRLKQSEFIGFQADGMIKVGGNLQVSQLGNNLCRVSTETRIFCCGLKAKGKFRAYWTVVRPFSGLIRLEWLRLIRAEAESEA